MFCQIFIQLVLDFHPVFTMFPADFYRDSFRLLSNLLTTSIGVPFVFYPTSCRPLTNFLPISSSLPLDFIRFSVNFYRDSCQSLSAFLPTSIRLIYKSDLPSSLEVMIPRNLHRTNPERHSSFTVPVYRR